MRVLRGAVVLAAVLVLAVAAAAPAWADRAVVAWPEGSVNVRGGPDLSAPRIGRLARDTEVEVLGTQGEWVRVRHPDGQGWIVERSLRRLPGPEGADAPPSAGGPLSGEARQPPDPRTPEPTSPLAERAASTEGENPAASLPADDPGHAAVPDAPGERGAYLADLAEEALPSYDAGAGLLSMLSGLLLVLALLAGLVWVARRVSGGRFLPGGRGSGPIRVLATRAVGPRQGLVLAEVGGLVWLLSQGPEGLRLVAEIRDEAALAQLDQRYGFRQTPFEAALRSRLDLESGAAAGPPGSEVAKGPEPTPEERLAALRRRPPAGGSP